MSSSMLSEPPKLDDEILEYMRQNDGELPQEYLPEVKLFWFIRLRHVVSNFTETLINEWLYFRITPRNIINTLLVFLS